MGDGKGMQAKAFVRLTSQFGTAAIGELKVVWLRDGLEAEKVKQIALTNLNITTQTSKPVSLSVQTASVELQETTQEEKQQSHDDLKIKTATFSAMLEGSGLRLEVTNLQASDFVFMEDAWVPRQLSGQVRYTSPTLQFSGSVNAQWENLNLCLLHKFRREVLLFRAIGRPRLGDPQAFRSTSPAIRWARLRCR
jgi:hypothetical protein